MIWLSVNRDFRMGTSSSQVTRKFHFWLPLACGGITAPHRVVPNTATRSWCRKDARAPRWLSGMNRLFEAPSRLLPLSAGETLIRLERPSLPFFGPFPLTRQMPANRCEVSPLYAGECVSEMTELRPAADVVRELGEAFENAGA
ncbi:hypothetical protein [Algiphilus sp.]|uniref:hypothetical protein n=2 Tax=Algiphilus sp. TaxID=1872431 RepID=UPI0032EF8D37